MHVIINFMFVYIYIYINNLHHAHQPSTQGLQCPRSIKSYFPGGSHTSGFGGTGVSTADGGLGNYGGTYRCLALGAGALTWQ